MRPWHGPEDLAGLGEQLVGGWAGAPTAVLIASVAALLLTALAHRRHALLARARAWRAAVSARASARARKADFLARAGADYGYGGSLAGHIDSWRAAELPALIPPLGARSRARSRARGTCAPIIYLDYAGAALPVASQLREVHALLEGCAFGNPHSSGPAAAASARAAERARQMTLRLLCGPDAHNWECVFVSGASAGLRLVAEAFPFAQGSRFAHAEDAHTSVLGMRRVAEAAGADVRCVRAGSAAADWARLAPLACADGAEAQEEQAAAERRHHLAVLALESNFDGRRVDLAAVSAALHARAPPRTDRSPGAMAAAAADGDSGAGCRAADDGGGRLPGANDRWWVLADVAKAASTGPVDLGALGADFAVLSFYKLFGAPTGLGCVLATRRGARLLRAARERGGYYGGGTVSAVLARSSVAVPRPSFAAAFADGTPHFLGALQLPAGFGAVERIGGFGAVCAHTRALGAELRARLGALRHADGSEAVVLYGAECASSSIVAFNVRLPRAADPNAGAGWVSAAEVVRLAACARPALQLRSGCFCNPGACQAALGLDDEAVLASLAAGHVCGDERDLDPRTGRPLAAVRASVGKDSSWEDVDGLVRFVARTFVLDGPDGRAEAAEGGAASAREEGAEPAAPPSPRPPPPHVLTQLYVHPLKSCAAQAARRWPLCARCGRLRYDREWAVVDATGAAMRLRQYPALAHIRPSVDLRARTLTLRCDSMAAALTLPLDGEAGGAAGGAARGAGGDGPGGDARVLDAGCGCARRPSAARDGGAAAHAACALRWAAEGGCCTPEGGPSPVGSAGAHDQPPQPPPQQQRPERPQQPAARARAGGAAAAMRHAVEGETEPGLSVCGEACAGKQWGGSAAAAWLSEALGVSCRLMRAAASVSSLAEPTAPPAAPGGLGGAAGSSAKAARSRGGAVEEEDGPRRPDPGRERLAFANEAPLLLLSQPAVDRLNRALAARAAPAVKALHFRPNLVVAPLSAARARAAAWVAPARAGAAAAGPTHPEDGWRSIELACVRGADAVTPPPPAAPVDARLRLRVTGPCARCATVDVDPTRGETNGAALRTLARYRRVGQDVHFGVFLAPERRAARASDTSSESADTAAEGGGEEADGGGGGAGGAGARLGEQPAGAGADAEADADAEAEPGVLWVRVDTFAQPCTS